MKDMKFKELKEKLGKIEKDKDAVKERFNKEMEILKTSEWKIIQEYLRENAKFEIGEKVYFGDRICFIGWRTINRDKFWGIEYKTLRVRKDGSPGTQLSSYSYPEKAFRKI